MDDEREELLGRIKELERRLEELDARGPEGLPPPTPEALVEEVERGPLAAELAPLWADVFERHPSHGDKLAFREGRLKTDAAFEIHKRLTASGPGGGPSRSSALGWADSWDWKLVGKAHEAKRGGVR